MPGSKSATRSPLPIDPLLPRLCEALRQHGAAVLVAETGAGKTTRVPPALVAAGLAAEGQVVVLEPRRLAARAAAQRMAEELGVHLGGTVGYQVRFDRRASDATRILVVTEGIFLRQIQADPFLEGVAAVIFDEFHGRSLTLDLAFAMARQVQREVRPDLRLLAMSATLDPVPVAAFLGDAPILNSTGRSYPVEKIYRPFGGVGDEQRLEALMASRITEALERVEGDVLAFLPGVGEIRRTAEALDAAARRRGLDLLELYGDLPLEEQRRVLEPGRRRRVVLATNVAESSVTVAGIEAVVDSGLEKLLRHDGAVGLDRLETVRIDRAAADQRAGRAGRLGPGVALRLWSEHEHRGLPVAREPEVRRLDISGALLQLAAWGETDAARFQWLESPYPQALERSRALLQDLGALRSLSPDSPSGSGDGVTSGGASGGRPSCESTAGEGTAGKSTAGGNFVLTEVGRTLAALPVGPRLGRLLVETARGGYLEAGARAAALLSERSPFRRRPHGSPPPPATDCDLADQEERLAAGGSRRGGSSPYGEVHRGGAQNVQRVADQLARLTRRALGVEVKEGASSRSSRSSRQILRRALFATFPDRLARRREGDEERAVMVGGRGLRLAPSCGVRRAELFVAVHLDAGRRGPQSEAWVRSASAVEPEWLEQDPFVDAVSESVEVEVDGASGRAIAWRRRRFHDLVLSETQQPASAAEASAALAAAAAEDPTVVLPQGDAAFDSFLARLRWLAARRPELELPTFDNDQLVALLPALAAGRRSFAELRRAPWFDVLRGSLSHAQLQALEVEAPERLQVPSGSRVRLRYEGDSPPVLAARIQELFGLAETPRLAGGRVPVLLHLLAPNRRPQQVTDDLASFWANTYPEVRKELAGRYPKHAWPEDPLKAAPERRPKRRR